LRDFVGLFFVLSRLGSIGVGALFFELGIVRTMESDLIDLFEGAKKAADAAALDGVTSSGPEVSQCIDALKQLKKFPVTYDTLVATQVRF